MQLDEVVALARGDYPGAALEAARVLVAHDLAVATSARSLVDGLLEEAERWDGAYTDLLTGRRVDLPSAITRNAQLVHALTQDDTHFGAMTHVGPTSLPLLLALGEQASATTTDLTAGVAAAVAAAELLGTTVAPYASSRGIRPTSLIGPVAALVGAGRMLGWESARTSRAVARAASAAYGTQQTWVEGSQEWLYQVAAAGLLAWQAARSSAAAWESAMDPFWGEAGLFTSIGASVRSAREIGPDPRDAATRIALKRYPVCAINQVPLALLGELVSDRPQIAAVETRAAPAFATSAGVGRSEGVNSWTRRLMSMPYGMAVMAGTGNFVVADLQRQPATVTDEAVRAMTVVPDASLPLGDYVLRVRLAGGEARELRAGGESIGMPRRGELEFAARRITPAGFVDAAMSVLDRGDATVAELMAVVTAGW